MLIQKLRLQRGWSQEQLAELSGLSVRTIQRLERGQPGSVESFKALCAVFDIDFSQLREARMEPVMSQGVSMEETLALARVRRIKEFYIHVAQYCVTIFVLAVGNYLLTPRYLWVGWVALGWGCGLAFHGLRAFGKIPFLTGEWERRQVERYLGRKL